MGLIVRGNHVGIVLTPAFGQPPRFIEGFDPRQSGLTIPWPALRRIEASDPWPAFRVTTRFGRFDETHELHPLRVHTVMSFTPNDEHLLAFESVVSALFDLAREHAPEAVEAGWLDVKHTPPEEVERLPTGRAVSDTGVYRTSEHVVARRPQPGLFRIVRTWLASSPEKPWRQTMREVVMTDRHLYAKSWGGHRFRVPIASLRRRLHGRYGGVVYVFGRRSFLVLPDRKGCALQGRLDARLERLGPGEEVKSLAA